MDHTNCYKAWEYGPSTYTNSTSTTPPTPTAPTIAMYSTHIQWNNLERKDFSLSFRQHLDAGDAASLSISAEGPFSVKVGEGFSHNPSYPVVDNALGISSTPIPGHRTAAHASIYDPASAPCSPKSVASSNSESSLTPRAFCTTNPFQSPLKSGPWTPSAQTLHNFAPAIHTIPFHATPVIPRASPPPSAGIATPAQPTKPNRHPASDPNADGTYAAYALEVCRSTGTIRIDILLDRTEHARSNSFSPIDQLPTRLADQMRHSTFPNALSFKFKNLIGARHRHATDRALKKVYDVFLSNTVFRTVERLRIEVPDQLLTKGNYPNTLELFPALKRFEWKGCEDCTLFPWRDGVTRLNTLEELSIEANMTQRDCLKIVRNCPDLRRLSFDLRDQARANNATSTQAQVAFSLTGEDSVALSAKTRHVDLPKLTTLSITSSSDVNLLLTRIVGRPNSFRWVLNLEGEAVERLSLLPFITLARGCTPTSIDLSIGQEYDMHTRSLRASLSHLFAYTMLRLDVHDGGIKA